MTVTARIATAAAKRVAITVIAATFAVVNFDCSPNFCSLSFGLVKICLSANSMHY